MNKTPKKAFWKVLCAGMAGNALEFYDFCLYTFFAVQLGEIFFPSANPLNSTLYSLAVFAVGFIMRPIGGIIFGHIGDRLGRRKALMICVSFMAFPTFCMGLIPGYADIGIIAPILLIICRLFQGLSTGGEYNGAAVFVVEHATSSKKGFSGSMITSSSYIGWFMAAAVSYPFVMDYMPSWSWRIPFLLGLGIGMIGIYLRQKIDETPEFEEYIQSTHPRKVPLIWLLKNYLRPILCTIGIAAFSGVIAVTTLTFMMTFLITFAHWSKASAMLVSMIGSFIYIFLSPFFGALSDKKDPRYICLWSIGIILIGVYPIFSLITSGYWMFVIIGQIMWAVITIAYQAPMNVLLAHFFPVEVRYSGIGVGYSVGMALFGGTSPFILIWLIEKLNNPLAAVLWIMFVSIIGFSAVFLSKHLKTCEKIFMK